MDIGILPETGGLSDCFLKDEWRVSQHSLFSDYQSAGSQTFPFRQEIGRVFSEETYQPRGKNPEVAISEIPPRSLYRKVQKQEALCRFIPFSLLHLHLVWVRHYLWIIKHQVLKVSDASDRDQKK